MSYKPEVSQQSEERNRLMAELNHLSNPQSDWPYGHQFRRDGNDSVCRCGFRLTPNKKGLETKSC
jgi:hypothetical protein